MVLLVCDSIRSIMELKSAEVQHKQYLGYYMIKF